MEGCWLPGMGTKCGSVHCKRGAAQSKGARRKLLCIRKRLYRSCKNLKILHSAEQNQILNWNKKVMPLHQTQIYPFSGRVHNIFFHYYFHLHLSPRFFSLQDMQNSHTSEVWKRVWHSLEEDNIKRICKESLQVPCCVQRALKQLSQLASLDKPRCLESWCFISLQLKIFSTMPPWQLLIQTEMFLKI